MRNWALRTAMLAACIVIVQQAQSQFLMDMIDTTKDLGKGMLSVYKKFDHLRLSGYMQPQYQAASDSGITSYAGGSFAAGSNNRFTLRRGRVRFDYARFDKDDHPSVQFVFQFDGTERGVVIRDFWGRLWENKWQLFSFTTGMFASPFGFEINVSSGDRESPERGRMSQILMRSERDLGAMVSFEPRTGNSFMRHLKVDAGFFNGQGLNSNIEFDRYKDFICQLNVKPYTVGRRWLISGGVSHFNGGLIQTGKYRYTTQIANGIHAELPDSSQRNGSKLPRRYYGANFQFKLKHKWGATELRTEYWKGTQTGSRLSSETPASVVFGDNSHIRQFNGAFICLLQNIVTADNQLIVKYDWYDPNSRVKGNEIGFPASNLTLADIRYHTLGFGFLHHFNENLKLTLYYEVVKNEHTLLAASQKDIKDNVFTCRLQFRF